ncbi:MAG: hypothetical protein IPN43_13855 [Chitinophagaceae bacterium]|nr:hypothetical protein [Chitinophagaceae bacterium]
MNDLSNFKLTNPELEADIYYLTSDEGGRKTPVATSYRGQFRYDNHDWDAMQQFLDKEWCEPGDTVKVLLQTASPYFHCGNFFVGKEFEIREGATIVGKGKISKVLRQDFNYWDGATFLKLLDKSIKPYSDPDDLLGYRIDFDGLLPDEDGKIIGEDLEFIMTGNPECMMIVKAKAKTRVLRTIAAYVIDKWENHLATSNQLFKVDFATRTNWKGDLEMDFFKLTFATWHSIYLTGEIIVS